MIDPTTPLAALLRAQYAVREKMQLRAEPAGPPRATQPVDTAPKDSAQVERQMALRVGGLSPDDPQRERKAFRIYLASVLMKEFGHDRLDDPGFDQMVDTVLARMEDDAELKAAVREAGQALIRQAASPPLRGR